MGCLLSGAFHSVFPLLVACAEIEPVKRTLSVLYVEDGDVLLCDEEFEQARQNRPQEERFSRTRFLKGAKFPSFVVCRSLSP